MATLKITNLNRVKTAVRKKIITQLRTPAIRKGVAEVVVKEIKATKFGSPSAKYKKWRMKNGRYNKLDPEYKLNKINITFTGELLQDLITNAKAQFSDGRANIFLEHSNKKHKKYKTSRGDLSTSKRKRTYKQIKNYKKGKTAKGNRSTYQEISDGVSKYYDYLKFSSKTKSKVIKFIKDNLFKNLK
jgi:hypothetical protein